MLGITPAEPPGDVAVPVQQALYMERDLDGRADAASRTAVRIASQRLVNLN